MIFEAPGRGCETAWRSLIYRRRRSLSGEANKGMEHMECTDCIGTTPTQSVYSKEEKHIKIFHNYWDSCINYEKSWYAWLHYIWNNPVKHGYAAHPSEWKWGSFFRRRLEDRERMLEIMSHYPCDRVNVWDDF